MKFICVRLFKENRNSPTSCFFDDTCWHTSFCFPQTAAQIHVSGGRSLVVELSEAFYGCPSVLWLMCRVVPSATGLLSFCKIKLKYYKSNKQKCIYYSTVLLSYRPENQKFRHLTAHFVLMLLTSWAVKETN